MPKQQITIEVDVPEGYEIVEWRKPKHGDLFLHQEDHSLVSFYIKQIREDACDDRYNVGNRIIVHKKWIPPSWMLEGLWLYKGNQGIWWLANTEPTNSNTLIANTYSINGKGTTISVSNICCLFKYSFEVPKLNKIQIHH